MQDLISVIIPTFSRPKMLGRAIRSVLSQTYNNYEILIIDDNGNDSKYQRITEEYVKKYIDNESIKYIKHEKNLGGCAARNTGIKNSSGKFIAFLDDDDEWKANFLETLICQFEVKSNIGAVYCNYFTQVKNKRYYSINQDKEFFKGDVFEKLLSGWCPVSTSLFMIKRECFEKVGEFDEELKSFQDYDMWLRISYVFEFAYVNEKLVIKYESHSEEQVGFNPYNRETALKYLEDKWSKILNKDEISLFEKFVAKHRKILMRNFIVYNKQKNIECDYFKLYKKYLKCNVYLFEKVLVWLSILFGARILDLKIYIIGRLLGIYKFQNIEDEI